MQATKITTPNGFVLIAASDYESECGCAINHVSSTEPQPMICVNHDQTGCAIGGRTMSASLVDALLAQARKMGAKIESINT